MKRNVLNSWLKFVGIALLTALLFLGLSACSNSKGERIDGDWISPTVAEEMRQMAILSADRKKVFLYTDHTFEEIFPKAQVNLNLKEDKFVCNLIIQVDREAYFEARKEEVDASIKARSDEIGVDYEKEGPSEGEILPVSDQELYQQNDETVAEIAEAIGGSYQLESSQIRAELFQAELDRENQTVKLTKVNERFLDGKIADGSLYRYKIKGRNLELKGKNAKNKLLFIKKKE